MKHLFLPEGHLLSTAENQAALRSPAALERARAQGSILEAMAVRCGPEHDLWVACGPWEGLIPRAEAAIGIREGTTREIAILSRVGKPTCFVVTELREREGKLCPVLSRRLAQERARASLALLRPGDILPVTVTHLEPFGAFVDVGCGLPSMIGVEHISVSRVPHPGYRFSVGQQLYALVTAVEPDTGRLTLSHRELLGTWAENAARFAPGETVAGYVRSIRDYGAFIELAPNLSGLAEPRAGLREGDRVSVFIRSITPERGKLKLTVLERLPPLPAPEPPVYFQTGPRLEHWCYAPEGGRPGARWDAPAIASPL